MAHNLARWTARIGLGERIATTKTLRRRVALVGRITRSARRLTDASPGSALALGNPVQSRLGPAASHSIPGLTASLQLDPTSPQSRATPVARVPCCVSSRHPAHRDSRIGP